MFQDLVYGDSLMGLISVGNNSLSETELDQMTHTDLRVLKFYRLHKWHIYNLRCNIISHGHCEVQCNWPPPPATKVCTFGVYTQNKGADEETSSLFIIMTIWGIITAGGLFSILITKLLAFLCDYFGILSAQPSSFVLCKRRRFSPRSLEVTEACHSDVFFPDLPWSPREAAECSHAGHCLAARGALVPTSRTDGRTRACIWPQWGAAKPRESLLWNILSGGR